MVKIFMNKIGRFFRSLKASKRKFLQKVKEESLKNENSEHIFIKKSKDSSSYGGKYLKLYNLRKSKSTESISTSASGNNAFNSLRRTEATCDILSKTEEEELKCTKSLERFSQLTDNTFLSYNVNVQNSKIWSQALDRAIERTERKKDGNLWSMESRIQPHSEFFDVQNTKDDRTTWAKSEKDFKYDIWKMDTKRISRTTSVLSIKAACKNSSFSDDIKPNGKHLRKSTSEVHIPRKFVPPSSLELSKFEKVKKELTVKMDFTTVKNEEGFDLIKCDLKAAAGDHEEKIERITSSDNFENSMEKFEETKDSTTENTNETTTTTDYDVNLAQIDLFKEFRSTIANMREVLNVPNAVQCNIERSTSGRKLTRGISTNLDREKNDHISTQTTTLKYNQISTSTDEAVYQPIQRNDESVMAQLSSNNVSSGRTESKQNSKNIILDSSLFNSVKPSEKIRKRKRLKRVHKPKYKIAKKPEVSLEKMDKSRYRKCVVYHITEHKNSMDRSVGTNVEPTEKGSCVIRETFSAVHSGPIQDFPVLLNKHENELKKANKKHNVQKHSNIGSIKEKSTFVGHSQVIKQNICHRSKTQPSLVVKSSQSEENSTTATTTTTTNWFVFDPAQPLEHKKEVKGGKVTKSVENVIIDKNRGSTQEMLSKILDDEFKTSGLKGKVSSGTMNLIKDQVCDQLNGVNRNEIPNAMITVCVPLKEIVTKLNTMKSDNSEMTRKHRCKKLKSSSDFAIQVNISENDLQTIPEKITTNTRELKQLNLEVEMRKPFKTDLKRNMENKCTGCKDCMNLSEFRKFPEHTTQISSDHATNTLGIITGNKLSTENYSNRPYTAQGVQECQGFFLDLPQNRYKQKREQISKLFDSSDSQNEPKCWKQSKLLYRVHDSSFYSSTLMENTRNESNKTTPVFPIQRIHSHSNIQLKPNFISFSELPSSDKKKETKVQKIKNSEKELKTVYVNTSNRRLCQDSYTQYEHFPRSTERDSFTEKLLKEFSIMSMQRVKFQKELNKKEDNFVDERNSVISLLNECCDTKEPKRCYQIPVMVRDQEVSVDTMSHSKKHRKTPSDKNFTAFKQEKAENTDILIAPNSIKKKKSKEFTSEVKIGSQSLDKIHSEKSMNFRMQNSLIPLKAAYTDSQNGTKLKELIRDIISMCNASFVKSRDCIVELTLYNLIREIIMEHCSHLSVQSKMKIETILSNFVHDSKARNENRSVKMVESALADLIRELDDPNEEKMRKNSKENVQIINSAMDFIGNELHHSDENERRHYQKSKHKRKYDDEHREKSKRKSRKHRHESKHKSHHDCDLIDFEDEKYRKRYKDDIRLCYERHQCDNPEKCEMSRTESITKFKSFKNKENYLDLVKRLEEVEVVTKQLSSNQNKNTNPLAFNLNEEQRSNYNQHHHFYTALTEKLEKFPKNSKRAEYTEKKFEATKKEPKFPLTKIVINLSNLKMLTKKCVSLISSSVSEPIVITDSTEKKQKLIDEIVGYQIRKASKHSSHHYLRRNKLKPTQSTRNLTNEEESITFTLNGVKNKKKHKDSSKIKPGKDFMKIKMVRKKKTITSSEQTPSSPRSYEKYPNSFNKKIKNEYESSEDFSTNVANEFFEDSYKINRESCEKHGNFNAAYQKLMTYFMFRDFHKRNSK